MTDDLEVHKHPESPETAGGVSGGKGRSKAKPRARADWQRPPFEAGNKLAVTHGAYSPEVVEATAVLTWPQLFGLIQKVPGYHEVDQLLVNEIRVVHAQLTQLRDRSDQTGGIIDLEGKPRPYMWLEEKLGRRLDNLLGKVGVGTVERAKIFGPLSEFARAQTAAIAAVNRLRDKQVKGKKGPK